MHSLYRPTSSAQAGVMFALNVRKLYTTLDHGIELLLKLQLLLFSLIPISRCTSQQRAEADTMQRCALLLCHKHILQTYFRTAFLAYGPVGYALTKFHTVISRN